LLDRLRAIIATFRYAFLALPWESRAKISGCHSALPIEHVRKGNEEMVESSTQTRLAVIGAGKMGGILIEAFVKQGLILPQNIFATVQHSGQERKNLAVSVGSDNRAAARQADVILLCVKPQAVGPIIDEIAPELTEHKLVISIAASVPTEYIERRLTSRVPVVRAMPNTPSQVGAGMTAISKGQFASQQDVDTTRRLFDAVGKTIVADEKNMDAITGLSASGPAFIYIILESLAEGGVKAGLPRELATLLAAQTALGAAKVVLDTGHHPALLKDAVTTPAGCTIDGILELEEGGLRVTLIKAVVRAAHRAKELLLKDSSA
jgi:pyrroline-5-carboxylate reductase